VLLEDVGAYWSPLLAGEDEGIGIGANESVQVLGDIVQDVRRDGDGPASGVGLRALEDQPAVT
jgi:hypothetical protein